MIGVCDSEEKTNPVFEKDKHTIFSGGFSVATVHCFFTFFLTGFVSSG